MDVDALRSTRQEPPQVLLIDDDDFIAVSLRQYLTARGCEVDIALDRASATEQLSARKYDLVLIDPYMTGEASRGGALLNALAALQPDAKLVLVSAYAPAAQAIGSIGATQPVAVLTKPQSVVFLSQLIISALGARTNIEEENLQS